MLQMYLVYGQSPVSVAAVCDPVTVRLDTPPSTEHWSWYSVMTPFGFSGWSQENETDVEVVEITVKSVGAPFGPKIHS